MTDAPVCYCYDRADGRYLGEVPADASPAEPGVWLYPACSTLVPPPVPGPQQAAVWSSDAWTLVPDHRGEMRWTDHATSYVVETLGEPEGSIEQPPAPPPGVPASVPRWRIRMALLTRVVPATSDTPEHSMLDAADALAEQAGGSVLIYWRDTQDIERAHPLTAQFGAALGLTPEQIDDVFLDAMTY